MKYEMTISPKIPVSEGDFIASWSQEERTDNAGTVRLADGARDVFDADILEGGDVVILETSNVGTDAGELYALIGAALRRAGASGTFTFTPLEYPDGSTLLAVSPADRDE